MKRSRLALSCKRGPLVCCLTTNSIIWPSTLSMFYISPHRVLRLTGGVFSLPSLPSCSVPDTDPLRSRSDSYMQTRDRDTDRDTGSDRGVSQSARVPSSVGSSGAAVGRRGGRRSGASTRSRRSVAEDSDLEGKRPVEVQVIEPSNIFPLLWGTICNVIFDAADMNLWFLSVQ